MVQERTSTHGEKGGGPVIPASPASLPTLPNVNGYEVFIRWRGMDVAEKSIIQPNE